MCCVCDAQKVANLYRVRGKFGAKTRHACGCIARTRLFKWFRVAPSAVIGHHSCICQDEVTCEAHRTNIRGAKHVTEGMGLMTFWDS